MNFNNRNIKLKAKTWIKDSYDLYDYETKDYYSHSLVINSPGKIIRSNNDILFINQGVPPPQNKHLNTDNYEILATVKESGGHITINAENVAKTDMEKLWQVVQKGSEDGERRGYQLKIGDIIKLGRIVFKVKQIKLEEKEKK
jgi:hypothetical protein